VRGDSMLPQIEDGWTLYYAADQSAGVMPNAVNRLSVVQVHDGPMLVKKLEPGRKKNLWRLVSFNASPRDDVRLDWAARVLAIVP
jgi:phage repressor protein C with HTH and peptisase S24 domain